MKNVRPDLKVITEREGVVLSVLEQDEQLSMGKLFRRVRGQRKDLFDKVHYLAFMRFIKRRSHLFLVKQESGHRGGMAGTIFVVSLAKKADAQPTVEPETKSVIVDHATFHTNNTVQALIAKLCNDFADNLLFEDFGLPPAEKGGEARRGVEIIVRITKRLEGVLLTGLREFVDANSTSALQELEVQLLDEKRLRALAEADKEIFREQLREEILCRVESTSPEERDGAMAHSSLVLRETSCASRT